jgi:biotin transport system substrate-specific component
VKGWPVVRPVVAFSNLESRRILNMNAIIGLSSARPAMVDSLRKADASTVSQIVGVVGFALLTALGAQIRLYLWEVPFSLQTLAVYGSGLYLGWRNGAASQLLYLTLGMFLPVYAGDGSGPAYLLGAVSGGYLLAFPLAAGVSGFLSRRWNTLSGSVLSMIAGSVCIFSLGVIWLHFAAGHATWAESLDRGWIRFVPVDLAKILLVGLVYSGSRFVTRQD